MVVTNIAVRVLYFHTLILVGFRTVKFWDLETFQLVSSTDSESSAVRFVFNYK